MTIIPFVPNSRTAARKRREREAKRDHMIDKLGLGPMDEADKQAWAEYLSFMVMCEERAGK